MRWRLLCLWLDKAHDDGAHGHEGDAEGDEQGNGFPCGNCESGYESEGVPKGVAEV